jgi:hypothetical protein
MITAAQCNRTEEPMFHIFTADTIAGRFDIAVKVSKDAADGDSRTDAYTVAFGIGGAGARLKQGMRRARKLSDSFEEAPTARGWAYVQRAA